MCEPARTHQQNRDHTLLPAGFEILPRPSMKKKNNRKTNLWSSDLKPLALFGAQINFSITEGVLGEGSAGQQLCWHRLPVAQGWWDGRWKRDLGGCWWWDLSTGVKAKPNLNCFAVSLSLVCSNGESFPIPARREAGHQKEGFFQHPELLGGMLALAGRL